ncbi:MAG TPA: LuxR C-terminal-related transcriptional regulator [Thermomicrobiales bacterium]|nr:LuxR C-terminal-related transcriptional regulator [Thermomicrobiales bacterium]
MAVGSQRRLMTTWRTVSDQVFDAVHRLCYAGLDASTLQMRAISQLRRAIPFEGFCAHDCDPASGLPMRQYLDPPNAQQGREFLENVAFADDVNDFGWMLRTGRRVALLSEATGGRLDRALRYREVLAPQGFGFDMRCVYALDGTAWGGISALRERSRADFTNREAALMSQLAPHLAAGLKAAALCAPVALRAPVSTGTPTGADTPGGPAVLVLDHRGRVTHYTPMAEYWLRRLTDLKPGWQEGQALPEVVWAVVGMLRRGLRPQTERDRTLVPRIRVRTTTGEWVQLQAALSEAPDRQSGETVIVMEPVGPREVTWLRLTAHGLSPREQEVVEWVARGASTAQIAQALFITEYTVQDHLKHIFDKVGVRNRRALVQHLYLEYASGGA